MTASAFTPRHRLARASVWTMAGTGIHLAAGMAGSIAAARILGVAHFGELAITRTTLFTITLIGGTSFGVAAARAVAAHREADPARAGRVLGLLLNAALIVGGLEMILFMIFSGTLARHLGAPQLGITLMLGGPYIVFTSFSAVATGALTALDAFDAAGIVLALEGVVTALLLAFGAYAGGVNGATAGMVTAALLAVAGRWSVMARVCRRAGVTVRHRGVATELPLIRTLVVPAVLFGAGAQPFAWLARAILTRGPNGLVEIGVFTAAYAWGASVLTVPSQVTRPAMPILTSLLASGDSRAFRRLLRDVLLAAFGTAVAMAVPMALLAPWIMRAYGSRFASGAIVLIAVAASSVLASLSAALRSALVAAGRVWGQAAQSLLWGITLVVTFYLLRVHGAVGLASAYVIAFAVSLCAQVVMTMTTVRKQRAAATETVTAAVAVVAAP